MKARKVSDERSEVVEMNLEVDKEV